MNEPSDLDTGISTLQSAIDHDEGGRVAEAVALYREGIACFERVIAEETNPRNIELLRDKVKGYKTRIEQLNAMLVLEAALPPAPTGTPGAAIEWRKPVEAGTQRARDFLTKALALDERGATDRLRAADIYLEAAAEFLGAANLCGEAAAAGASEATAQQLSLRRQAEQVIARVEEIKGLPPRSPAAVKPTSPAAPSPRAVAPNVTPLAATTAAISPGNGNAAAAAAAAAGAAAARRGSSGGSSGNRASLAAVAAAARLTPPAAAAAGAAVGGLTAEEISVLRASSIVNGKLFLPWIEEDVVQEKLSYPQPWSDPDGLLPLSAKQRERFVAYQRPSALGPAAAGAVNAGEAKSGSGGLVMIRSITPFSITQDTITDCSFVASLCIASAFERRFRKQLITRIIYPQDSRGVPRYNPSGKYMVKLWVNGVVRKVVVDDFLPVGPRGRLLCSASEDPTELWVSIIEKAYLKVNGGYDFPGSNSGIDLFALTGWLPEHIMFEEHRHDKVGEDGAGATRRNRRNAPLDNYQSAERVWQRLKSAHEFGDCLITVATEDMSEAQATKMGLVPSHAYAVLDVKEALGVRLLQVKNPWARVRWLGPYSVEDAGRWTPEMKRALGYDVDAARLRDNGVFWIDYGSVCKYFRNVFMNWNPALFSFRTVLHGTWKKEVGPRNDTYNLGSCPQFTLTVLYPPKPALGAGSGGGTPISAQTPTVWVLLSRHVTELEHDAEAGDFVTLHVYDVSAKQGAAGAGRRVYYPDKPLYRGIYTNNPHTLCRFDLPPQDAETAKDERGQPCRSYALVVSQYEKRRDISYTLNVYCTSTFRLRQSPPPPEHVLAATGCWEAATAGGGVGLPGFRLNPQFSLGVATAGQCLHLQLEAPKDLNVNVTLVAAGGKRVETVPIGRLAPPLEDGEALSSGSYRAGFCYLAAEPPGLHPGVYTVVVSTYKPGQLGAFVLKACSSAPLQHLRPIPQEGEGMSRAVVRGAWAADDGSAAGCSNFGRYLENPRYLFTVSEPTTILLRLTLAAPRNGAEFSVSGFSDVIGLDLPAGRPPINISVFSYSPESPLGVDPRSRPNSRSSTASRRGSVIATSNNGVYTDAPGGAVTTAALLEPGSYVALPSTFEPTETAFSLVFFSTPAMPQPQRLV